MTWTVFAIAAVIVVASWLRALANTGKGNDQLRQQRLHEHLTAAGERIHPRDGMPRITMRIGDAWPDDQPLAERVGKHRAARSVPLDDQPGEVIQAVVTDLKERGQK